MDELLTEEEAANVLKCSVRWLRDKRYAREVPFIALGPKLIRYDHSALMDWARSQSEDVQEREIEGDREAGE